MGDSPAVVPISFLRIKAFNVTFVLIMTKPHLLLSLQVRRIVLGLVSLGGTKTRLLFSSTYEFIALTLKKKGPAKIEENDEEVEVSLCSASRRGDMVANSGQNQRV